ncbi:hypothetical protein HIM_05276 [Hirsutella minnesotensis 3608]|uniref:Crh-like protein n=1 Tax=Hirsutella minnesotensis 3608 TaxID=1043627 RepID=A0A0F7ZPE3_9HYPO|nr:hypothetical protein HIM_05276 [Hirsutella minnesotensis 3608]
MFPKGLTSTVALALAASTLTSAQTHTDCDPTKVSCPADPALGKTETCDFTKGKCDIFKPKTGTTLKYGDKGAVFSIDKEKQGPTIETDKYMFFGRVDVTLQSAPTQGLITSIVLESDALDEIDWEWIGSETTKVQTNYFRHGADGTWDRGGVHTVSNPASSFHKYSIEWTKEKLEWFIDDKSIRSLSYADAKGKFPQTPMKVKLGTWVVSKSNPEGTQKWAGGAAEFDKGPFEAFYKSVTIVDYAGGSEAAKGGIKEYVYGDKSGGWESIKVVKGDGSSVKNNKEDGASSSSSSDDDKAASKTASTNASSTTGTSSIATLTHTTSTASSTATTLTRSSNRTSTGAAATATAGSFASRFGTSVAGVVTAVAVVGLAQLML